MKARAIVVATCAVLLFACGGSKTVVERVNFASQAECNGATITERIGEKVVALCLDRPTANLERIRQLDELQVIEIAP